MSDHLPPLADLLPHLHAGDHITAERCYGGDTIEITGVVREPRCEPGALKLGGLWVRNGRGRAMGEYTITSAPDAHQRWMEAQQPTWADDPNVAMVDDGEERWIRDYPEELDSIPGTWRCVDSDIAISRSTDELIKRGARPVARYITDQPAPEPLGYVMEPTWCAAGVGGGEICARRKGHDGAHNADPAPEPATCDRDHEPPIGSVVRSASKVLVFELGERGWRYIHSESLIRHSWTWIWDTYGPLTLVEDGTNTGAEQ